MTDTVENTPHRKRKKSKVVEQGSETKSLKKVKLGAMKDKKDTPEKPDIGLATKESDETVQTKPITDVEFKFLLRDPKTVTEGLENFISTADAHADGAHADDIIASFCRSSPTCTELFDVMGTSDNQSLKPSDISLAFKCLEQILIHVRSDMAKLGSTGEAIVQRVLAANMGQVYRCLRDSNKSKTIKSGLQLLIAMAMLSEKAKKALQAKLNFEHQPFEDLFKRRNRKDPSDVRSSMVLLTLSFILDTDSESINTLAQQRKFLQNTIGGLRYDSRDMVVDVLETLLDKVVQCPAITKTTKIKLFSEWILKQLSELFTWRGPRGWKARGRGRQEEDDGDEDMEEGEDADSHAQDVAAVAEVAQRFLIELCCSRKNGIHFYDKTIGTGKRQHNQLLAHFLDTLVKQLDKPHVCQLVFSVCQTSPDLLGHLITSLAPLLYPRWSDKWEAHMDMLTKLYKAVPDVMPELSSVVPETVDVTSLVGMLSVFCLPPLKLASVLIQGVKHDDDQVRHKVLSLLHVFCVKCVMSLTQLREHVEVRGYVEGSKSADLVESFRAHVLKTLPHPDAVLSCVDKAVSVLGKLEAGDVPDVDPSSHTVSLLQVLIVYQQLLPSVLSDKPRFMAKVIELVGRLPATTEKEKEEDKEDEEPQVSGESPQLSLLRLLSETDIKKVSLGKEGLLEKLILSASSNVEHQALTAKLISKMLQSVEVLKGHDQELHIWLMSAISQDSASEKTGESEAESDDAEADKSMVTENDIASSATFLSHILSSLVNNPTPFAERLGAELATEDNDDDVGTIGKEQLKKLLETANHTEIDSCLEKGLEMGTPSTSKNSYGPGKTDRTDFSPLVLVALDNLLYNKTVEHSQREYLGRVLVRLLHCQPHPLKLCQVILRSTADLGPGVREYFEMCKPKIGLIEEESDGKKKQQSSVLKVCSLLNPLSSHLLTTYLEPKARSLSETNQKEVLEQWDPKSYSDLVASVPVHDRAATLGQILNYLDELVGETNIQAHKKESSTVVQFCTVANELHICITESAERKKESSKTVNSQVKESQTAPTQEDCQRLQVEAANQILLHPICIEGNMESLAINYLVGNVLKRSSGILHLMSPVVLAGVSGWADWVGREKEKVVNDGPAKGILKFIKEVVASRMDVPECAQALQKLLNAVHAERNTPTQKEFITCWLSAYLDHVNKSEKELSTIVGKDSEAVGFASKSLLYGSQQNFREFCKLLSLETGKEEFDMSKLGIAFDVICLGTESHTLGLQILQTLPEGVHALPDTYIDTFCNISTLDVLKHHNLHSEKVSEIKKIIHIMMHNREDVCGKMMDLIVEHIDNAFEPSVSSWFWWLLSNCLSVTGQSAKLISFGKTIEHFIIKNMKNILSKKMVVGNVITDASLCVLLLTKKTASLDLWKEFLFRFSDNQFVLLKMHFEILNAGFGKLQKQKKYSKSYSLSDASGCIVEACLKHLTACLQRKTRDLDLENAIVNCALAASCSVLKADLCRYWDSFVKSSLKLMYTNASLLKLLALLIPIMFDSLSKDSGMQKLSSHLIFQMCISHTAFLDTLLTPPHVHVKDQLVHLLYALCQIEPLCYTAKLSNVLTAAYSASMSITDQRLLYMLEKFSQEEKSSFECPSMWGKAAIEERSVSDLLGPSLDRQVSVKNILEQLEPSLMHKSGLSFPVLRVMSSSKQTCKLPEDLKSTPESYDPRFLLQLFNQALSEDKMVPVRFFVEKNCLSYLLVALSSHDLETRLMSYQALNRFYHHLDGSRCHEKFELTFVLDLLNASRSKEGQKLTSIIALFFARVVKLMLYPADPLYVPVFKFLVAKPQLDLSSVPEFYKLFFSTSTQLKAERQWMLSLLAEGVRETSDYRLLQKYFIFKILMSFYSSLVSDQPSQASALTVILAACKGKAAAVDLVKNHGLLTWLSGVVVSLGQQSQSYDLVCEVCCTLWFTLTSAGYSDSAESQTSNPPKTDEKKKVTVKVGSRAEDDEEESMEEDGSDDSSEDEEDSEDESDESQPSVVIATKDRAMIPKATLLEMSFIVKSFLPHMKLLSKKSVQRLLHVINSIIHFKFPGEEKDGNQTKSCFLILSDKDMFLLSHAVCKSAGDSMLASKIEEVMLKKNYLSEAVTSNEKSGPPDQVVEEIKSNTTSVNEDKDEDNVHKEDSSLVVDSERLFVKDIKHELYSVLKTAKGFVYQEDLLK